MSPTPNSPSIAPNASRKVPNPIKNRTIPFPSIKNNQFSLRCDSPLSSDYSRTSCRSNFGCRSSGGKKSIPTTRKTFSRISKNCSSPSQKKKYPPWLKSSRSTTKYYLPARRPSKNSTDMSNLYANSGFAPIPSSSQKATKNTTWLSSKAQNSPK